VGAKKTGRVVIDVVIDTVTQDWVCLNCGERYHMNLPAPLEVMTAAMRAFAKAHRDCQPRPATEKLRSEAPGSMTADEWLTCGDTGLSSITIWSVMTGRKPPRFRPSVPIDPADFGRCHRLLQRFPEWRVRLGEVGAAYPEWAGLVRCWDELTALYEQELPRGTAPKLYARMQGLLGVDGE
jgi:hypothetical protein